MNLTQLLTINGELEEPFTDSEFALAPGMSGDFSQSKYNLLKRWDFGERETTGKGKLPFALLRLNRTQYAESVFSKAADGNSASFARRGDAKQQRDWGVVLRRLALWLLIAVLALASMACGFGVQEIRFTREKYQLGQRLRAAEQKQKVAELAARQMHASLVLYAARESRQKEGAMQTRPAAYPRPKARTNTTL